MLAASCQAAWLSWEMSEQGKVMPWIFEVAVAWL